MRKLVFAGLMAATLIPAMASAQSAGELRNDRRDIRQEERDVHRAERDGAGPGEIRDQRQDVRDARRETREDWRDYRRAHPDVYRGAGYVGPRGWAYRPVTAGYRFTPTYYDRRYWIEPARYHLAAPGRYERWIRYGRDVVLVDIRGGRVIRVNSGFFF